MNKILIIILIFLFSNCHSPREFNFPTTYPELVEIDKYNNQFYFTEVINTLLKLENDSLIQISPDSLIDVENCLNESYLLQSINDSTLLLLYPDNTKRTIKNRTDIKNEYIKIFLNEKCEILLGSSVFFPIQENNSIGYDKAYGFQIRNLHGTDKYGYYDNFIFLIKYPDYFQGRFNISYLDSSKYYSIPTDTKVRDFTIHDGVMWMALGYYHNIDDEELIESKLATVQNGKIKEETAIKIPSNFDISNLFSDGENLYVLSEKTGFYKIENSKFEHLISINLINSGISPENFFVDDNGTIYLTTWRHGLLIIKGELNTYDIKQIKN